MMKNTFYFSLKAHFVLKMIKFFSSLNFNIYDVTAFLTNNGNTYIAQYLKK